jgi:hypothetical protein
MTMTLEAPIADQPEATEADSLAEMRDEQIAFESALRSRDAGTATAKQFAILEKLNLSPEQLQVERQRLLLVDRLLPEAGTAEQYGAAVDAENETLAEKERSLPRVDRELKRLEAEVAVQRAERARLIGEHEVARQKRAKMDVARVRLRTTAPPVFAQLHGQQSRRLAKGFGRQYERAELAKRAEILHRKRGLGDDQARQMLNDLGHDPASAQWDWLRPFFKIVSQSEISDAIHLSFSNEPDAGKPMAEISAKYREWCQAEYDRVRAELVQEEQALAQALEEVDGLLDFYTES